MPPFRDCPGLRAVEERVSRESPWFDRFGIHVLVSQNGRGELTIGDSHQYGRAIEPFDLAEIEGFILEYLRQFLDVPGLRIVSRWHGTYAKHLVNPYVILEPCPGVVVVTGVGGVGMTLSFGLAEKVVADVLGPASNAEFPTASLLSSVHRSHHAPHTVAKNRDPFPISKKTRPDRPLAESSPSWRPLNIKNLDNKVLGREPSRRCLDAGDRSST